MGQEHYEYIIIHDHAGSRLIRKSAIEPEAELGKELDRPFEISYRQIDENFSSHFSP